MLRRKYKKMRKKRGGSVGFFDKFKSGFDTVKSGIGKGLSKTQEGINKAKIGVREAKENYDAEINKAREGGEYSPLAKKVLEGSVNKNIRKDPVGYVAAQQHWMKDTGVPTTFDRNPLFEPVKPKRKRQFTLGTDSNIKRRIELDGGRRKRKTRRRKKRGGNDPTIGQFVFVKWPHDDGSYKYYIGQFMGRYKKDNKWYKWAEYDESTQTYKKTQGINFEIYPFVSILPAEVKAAQGLTELIDSNNQNVEDPPLGGGRKRKTRRRRKRKTHKKKRKKRRKTRRRR